MRTRAVLIAAVVALAGIPASAQQRHTYVIVHGAWGGGWDWRAVDSLLTLRGHRVLRVTLTGQGERSHLASPDIGLSTHIADVVNTILWENLHEVVLVGHSYGGTVITGVVDRIPERIRRAVYIDAFLPDSGESVHARTDAAGARDGMIVPAWVTDTLAIPRDVPQSARTFTDTLRLVNPAARQVPGTYILTVEPAATADSFQRFAERAARRGWVVDTIRSDHNPQRSARGPLVELLDRMP